MKPAGKRKAKKIESQEGLAACFQNNLCSDNQNQPTKRGATEGSLLSLYDDEVHGALKPAQTRTGSSGAPSSTAVSDGFPFMRACASCCLLLAQQLLKA